jgi:hypothetical protein
MADGGGDASYWHATGPRGAYAVAHDDVESLTAYGLHLKILGVEITACGMPTWSWSVYWGVGVESPTVCRRCRIAARLDPRPEVPPAPIRVSPDEVARHAGLDLKIVSIAMDGGLRGARETRAHILAIADLLRSQKAADQHRRTDPDRHEEGAAPWSRQHRAS